jgi:cytochrome b-561
LDHLSKTMSKLGFFRGLFLLIGLIATPLLFVAWIVKYLGGFSDASDMSASGFFNWHIFVGSVSVFWLFFPASLLYHVGLSYKLAKTLHWILLTAATIGFVSAVIIAYKYHEAAGYEDWYSVHSWLGLLTTVLFVIQVSRHSVYGLFCIDACSVHIWIVVSSV